MSEAAASAVRSPDPFYRPLTDWVTRRLAPQCSKIDLGVLATSEDVLRVLWAMGGETANVHLGTPVRPGRSAATCRGGPTSG